jgi:hypothetical protein
LRSKQREASIEEFVKKALNDPHEFKVNVGVVGSR